MILQLNDSGDPQRAIPAITPSRFPDDAHALISRAVRSPMMSRGPSRERGILTFEPRYPHRIEPLMGWTEDNDPLAQVELSFPSAEAATAYAHRNGLRYSLYQAPPHDQHVDQERRLVE